MKVSEIMAGKTPEPTYTGTVNTNDFVFAIDTSADGSGTVADYTAAWDYVTSNAATLNPTSEDKSYMSGTTVVKTATTRKFAPAGDLAVGDEFIDFCMSHKVKFGKGSDIVVPYVYFNALTGLGEQGNAAVVVDSDADGDAQSVATFGITVTATGTPTEYTYSAV